MQVERMAGIMVSARQECCALLQQSYQQLYNLLGAVEGDKRAAMVTPEQACSIAAALKGGPCLGQQHRALPTLLQCFLSCAY